MNLPRMTIEPFDDVVWCDVHGNVHSTVANRLWEEYGGVWGASDATECTSQDWAPVAIVRTLGGPE